MRIALFAALFAALLALISACGTGPHTHGAVAGQAPHDSGHGHAAADRTPPDLEPAVADKVLGADGAPVYDRALVPDGARVAVVSMATGEGSTHTVLVASGFLPRHDYGVHVHVQPCGPDPAAAGAHFQYRVDPNLPSTDLAFLNPRNEIWLDFSTDDAGAAHTSSSVEWQFSDRRAKSVVVHDGLTNVHAAHASGPPRRIACLNVDF